MKKLLLITLILSLLGCKGEGGGGGDSGGGGSTPSKSLFSSWSTGNFTLNFTGGQFDTLQTMYLYLPVSQEWIDALNANSRDTTGLVAGQMYVCEMQVYFLGDESSGNIAVNHDDINEPAHNACLEWDNNCVTGVCSYSGDHLYTKTGNTLVIDYFGTADSGAYGVDYLE